VLPAADGREAGRRQCGGFPADDEVAAVSDRGIRRYVAGMLRAAAEVVIEPRLLPTFVAILTKVPGTLRRMALVRYSPRTFR
jgi:hypothetical protein